jgi:gluconolactonase
VWLAGALLFSDIPNNRIERLVPPATVTVFRDPSANSNGLAIDATGQLITCEQSNHRVTRTLADGSVAVVADQWQGQPFDSPNDATVRKDGTIYFTDPGFDYPAPNGPPKHSVYRVDPSGQLSLGSDGFDRPNGITLSISEQTLYVSDTLVAVVRSLAVNADGSLGPPLPFVSTAPIADGMCIDDAGNLYVTTANAVQLFLPDGTLHGEIPVPETPANCAFGGADRRTLYITAQKTLYSVEMPVPGRPY